MFNLWVLSNYCFIIFSLLFPVLSGVFAPGALSQLILPLSILVPQLLIVLPHPCLFCLSVVVLPFSGLISSLSVSLSLWYFLCSLFGILSLFSSLFSGLVIVLGNSGFLPLCPDILVLTCRCILTCTLALEWSVCVLFVAHDYICSCKRQKWNTGSNKYILQKENDAGLLQYERRWLD